MTAEAVLEFLRRFGVDLNGRRVLAAVSGGADSVCLLRLLCSLPGADVCCAHYNHGLRGAESDRDEAFVRSLCAGLGVKFVSGRGDVAAYAAESGKSTELAARELRYAFLRETMAAEACDYIATAHNADDNAETVLMNLARGAGTRGLGGIPPVNGPVIRPLLLFPRTEILTYLEALGQPYVEDSTNALNDYFRNRVRHEILPALTAEYAGAETRISSAVLSLREDDAYLTVLAERFIEEQLSEDSCASSALAGLPDPVFFRVLRLKCGPGIARVHVEAVRKLCIGDAPHARLDLPGCTVRRDFDRILFSDGENSPAAAPIEERTLVPGASFPLPETGKTVSCTETLLSGEIYNSFNTFCFKSERICGKIKIRSRLPGDRIRLAGRGCTKSLKQLFLEAALPLSERDRICVLADDSGVIAVEGFGIAERCAPEPGDTVLRVELKPDPGRME